MTRPRSKLSVATLTMILLYGFLPAAFGHEVSLSCPAAFGTAPDASGLIAYYPLDGNTVDATGNGMDAIEVIAAEPVKGKIGQGYYFNGKDSYIRLPLDISPYAYSQITVTAWIKPETVKQKRYVVSQGEKGDRNLFIYNSAVSASRALVGDPKHTIYPARWTFVALTYDQAADTAVLLSDSTFSALDKVGIPELSFPSVLLGARAPGNSVFAGVIDEVRIYNRALTTTELAGLRNGSSPTRVAGSGPGQPNQIRNLDGSNMSQPGQSSRDNQATPAFDESSPAIFSSPPPPTDTSSQRFDESSPAIFSSPPPPTDTPSQNFDESSPAIFTSPLPPGGAPVPDLGENREAVAYPQTDIPVSAAGVRQNVGPNPGVLPGDQLENPSAADIPAGPNYRAAEPSDGACINVTCPVGQVCVQGGCFDGVNSAILPSGDSGCENVVCSAGMVCLNGGCFDSDLQSSSQNDVAACANVTCPTDATCLNGVCLVRERASALLCANITCPDGMVCSNGGCFLTE